MMKKHQKKGLIKGDGMTEKRFTINTLNGSIDLRDNNEVMTYKQVVDLLNALHEENRELQRHLDVMRSGALTDDKRIKELYDENEQLKEDVTDTNMANSILQERVEHYRKENEQLRNNIKEAYQTERTMIGKSVLKQLIEQME